jgi:hypothetical protein
MVVSSIFLSSKWFGKTYGQSQSKNEDSIIEFYPVYSRHRDDLSNAIISSPVFV